ncbi:DUF7009 family protein [Mucilaginibacter sp. AW1-3]
MKIRIKGSTLRYRLTKTDVEFFSKKGYLEEVTNFGDQQFIYALQKTFGGQLTATLGYNKITMLMPDVMVDEWTLTDRVGFENNTATLYLLIEKDFVCIDNVLEDQSDNYPNPNMEKC